MIKDLYKFQFREAWRSLRLVQGLGLVAIMFSFLLARLLSWSWLNAIAFIILWFVCVVSLVYTLWQDYQNIHGSRAYFFNSIPASPRDQLVSRYLTYLTLALAVVVVVLVSLCFGFALDMVGRGSLPEMLMRARAFLKVVFSYFMTRPGSYVLVYFVLTFLLAPFFQMCAISVGSEARWHRLSGLGPILVGAIYYFTIQILSLVTLIFVPLAVQINDRSGGPDFSSIQLVTRSMFSFLKYEAGEVDYVVIGIAPFLVVILFCVWTIFRTYQSSAKRLSLN